jgi:hypothetical protein
VATRGVKCGLKFPSLIDLQLASWIQMQTKI